MKKVLFVDNEINVLNGLRRMFHAVAADWSIHFSTSGEDALELMRSVAGVDVLITDLSMDGMNGVDFLMRVREEFPDTIRFVLSATTDGQLIVRASSVAHQILGKPCEPRTVLHAVARAIALRDHLKSGEIKAILNKMGKLPPLPVVYEQILRESALEDASVRRIGKLIERDPSLSAKVLQIVNSPYMGLRAPISNLLQASSMLGLRHLKDVVLMAEVFGPSGGQKFAKGFDLDALWRHCLLVAEATRLIARHETSDKDVIDQSYAAGLLHEVGQLILASQLSGHYTRVIQHVRDTGLSLSETEKHIVGVTGAQVGSYLLELWGLPDVVIEAIAFHARPSLHIGLDRDLAGSATGTDAVPAPTVLTGAPCGELPV